MTSTTRPKEAAQAARSSHRARHNRLTSTTEKRSAQLPPDTEAIAANALQNHRCLTNDEVTDLRAYVDRLGSVWVLGINAPTWSAIAYAVAASVLSVAVLLRPHVALFAVAAVIAAVGLLAAAIAGQGQSEARQARWRLEDDLARLSEVDVAWLRSMEAASPLLAATLATWKEGGRRLRQRDLSAVRAYVEAVGITIAPANA